MSFETVTYSQRNKSWTSRWTWYPDWMEGLGNKFFSWKNGSLWTHDSNETRGSFYGTTYSCEITGIMNDNFSDDKVFKTIHLDSDQPWDVELSTDLMTGYISKEDFQKKESFYFAYIRNNSGNIDLESNQSSGLGYVSLVSVLTLTISGSVDGATIGDSLYTYISESLTEIGTITAINGSTVTVDSFVYTPTGGEFVFSVRNSQAESTGLIGYNMSVRLINDTTEETELFEVTSNNHKSFHS